MDDQASKVAVLEIYVKTIMADVDEIKDTQKEILVSASEHAIDSERYRILLDEIVDEKRAKIERMDVIKDKLITSSIWGIVVLLLTSAWAGLKGKIFG